MKRALCQRGRSHSPATSMVRHSPLTALHCTRPGVVPARDTAAPPGEQRPLPGQAAVAQPQSWRNHCTSGVNRAAPLPAPCSHCDVIFAAFCARRRHPGATSVFWRTVRGTAPERRHCGQLRRQCGPGLVCRAHRRRAARRVAPIHLLLGGYPAARVDAALAQLTGQEMGQEYVRLSRDLPLVCAHSCVCVALAVCPREWQFGVRIPRLSQQAEHADSRSSLEIGRAHV